jgi:PAS domain S-box-containing protein
MSAKPYKPTILIVDDRSSNILAMESILVGRDRNIIAANSGEEALKILLHKSVDLILLDVQMPGMDGFEVVQLLKLSRKTREIPVILVTAEKKEFGSIIKGYEEGAIDYLLKPLEPELVNAKVSVLLKLHLQKKELEEKNKALEKCAYLIDNCPDIIGILDAGTFKIEEINRAFELILGFETSECVEVSILFFLAKEGKDLIEKYARSDRDSFSFEIQMYKKDRSLIWVHWNVKVIGSKWYFNARDITRIKRVERIRKYLATVVKRSSNAVYLCDREGKIISWNQGAEKIYRYSEKEALQMKIWNIIPEVLQPEAGELVKKILAGKTFQDMETKRISKTGQLVDVIFNASLLRDEEGDQVSIAIMERDITRQNQDAEKINKLHEELIKNIDQLEEANKELESFSYSVSHDLRAPVRALLGYSNILEEDFTNELGQNGLDWLFKIRKNAEKMGRLIDDLLDFSRIGRKSISKSKVSFADLVNEAIAELHLAEYPNLELEIKTLPNAWVDYGLFHQVWINLISNAVKYSSKKEIQKIEIGGEKNGDLLTYYIRDNGVGFLMEYADKLFAVFQRLHSQDEFEGTGVGLAIVQRIISKHGGKIWAESRLNVGSVFYFTLPDPE